MKKIRIIFLPVIVLVLAATGVWFFSRNQSSGAAANQSLLGGDRDIHGCIGSAGYSWDEASQKCVRPWEELEAGTNRYATWKSYTNNEYGFSIKYPDYLYFGNDTFSQDGGFHYISFGQGKDPNFVNLITIRIYPNQTDVQGFSRYFNGMKGTWSDVRVGDIRAREFTNVNQDNRGITLILFVKDGFGYEVSSTPFGQYSAEVKEMVSTMVFNK